MDYCMPRADDFCSFALANNPVPAKTNILGIKGAGEAGNYKCRKSRFSKPKHKTFVNATNF